MNSGGPTKFYQQMQDAEMAKAMATGHNQMGIAQMIVRQFKSSLGETEGKQIQANHPPVSPLPAQAMERYLQMNAGSNNLAQRLELRLHASNQGQAVADTLQRFENEITQSAETNGLDPALILAVVMEESAGDPLAESHKGAQGLMQLMPATARDLGVQDSTSPSQNLAGGAKYLSQMLKRYDGDLKLALAAYNAGPGNVDKAGRRVPDFPETQNYVEKVMDRFKKLGGTKMASKNLSWPTETRLGD
ncbi:MAG: transglycosylase SLT domain-containing protein [bacterium]|nr:transglycosylase SLT domain-containing protein [bacterium]